MSSIKLERLSKESFAEFGDVITMEGNDWFPINNGTTRRYHHLGKIQVEGSDGQAGISLARGDAFHFPLHVAILERHPRGSQAWIPFNSVPFVAVVAPNGADDNPDESAIRAFYVEGSQGVNYHAGTWHHPLMAVGATGDFVVIDRIGTGPNCDERILSHRYTIDGALIESAAV